MRRYKPKNRKSINIFPSLSKKDEIDPTCHMFIQDVYRGIMPIGGKARKHAEFAVHLDGEKADCEQALTLCRSLARYEHLGRTQLVCSAIEEIATYLAWFGRVTYEIIQDEEDAKKITIHNFTTRKLLKMLGYYIQVVPSADYSRYKKHFVALPSKDVWDVNIPSALGNRSGYNRMLSKLQRFKSIAPQFWFSELGSQKLTSKINFPEYALKSDIYIRRVTKLWGWNSRDWSQERCTEFFSFYRHITFLWAQAVLREHIIAELNQLFARLDIRCKLVIAGLPISNEILGVRRELMAGKKSFGQASDFASL